MVDLNRATILGRLTRDPELRTTNNGRPVATIGVATNRTWTDQNGAKQELVEYHNCVLWGKLAEIAGQYLTKGRRVYFEGRLQTRDWTGQDGVKRYRTEIVVENMIMLDGSKGGGTPTSMGSGSMDNGESSFPVEDTSQADEIRVEDIPF